MAAGGGHFSLVFVVFFTSTDFFLTSFVLEFFFGRISVWGYNKAFIFLLLREKYFAFEEPSRGCPTLPQSECPMFPTFPTTICCWVFVVVFFLPSVELLQVVFFFFVLTPGSHLILIQISELDGIRSLKNQNKATQ